MAKSLKIETFEKKLRVALLGSSTLNGIDDTLKVKCSENNIGCISYVADYNQYNQEILNSNSKLYKFCPDVTFLFLDTRSICGRLYYFPYEINESERQEFVKKKLDEILQLTRIFVEHSNSKLIISNLSIPVYSPYGIFESKSEYGFKEMIIDFNSKLTSSLKSFESVYLYDFDGFVRKYGISNIFNFRQFFFGDIKVSLDYIPYLVDDWIGFIKSVLGLSKKCIVLDLDNTLWGGIIGEDEFTGIKLGDSPEGKTFVEFQKILLSLQQRGVILAINSKNNPDDALHVIREHPNMILKENHFACIKINWNDKIENIKNIAKELNIGLDSMVFFDDDPVNREYMRLNLPQVLTVEVPDDSAEYAQCLMNLNEFNVLKITDEDTKRGQMYIEEKNRKEFEASTSNIEDFLKQLRIKLIFKNANSFTIPRISQLTLKTNQFNLTTRRYQEEDIKRMSQEPIFLIGCVKVEDKFGDNGITGVFIIKKEKSEWLIDTFLLSCRIMGRKIEDGILGYIIQKARLEGVSLVKAEFIPTKKNQPCENFLADFGFKKDNNYWIYNTKDSILIPEHISYSEDYD